MTTTVSPFKERERLHSEMATAQATLGRFVTCRQR
jgi:hypothetical protein